MVQRVSRSQVDQAVDLDPSPATAGDGRQLEGMWVGRRFPSSLRGTSWRGAGRSRWRWRWMCASKVSRSTTRRRVERGSGIPGAAVHDTATADPRQQRCRSIKTVTATAPTALIDDHVDVHRVRFGPICRSR